MRTRLISSVLALFAILVAWMVVEPTVHATNSVTINVGDQDGDGCNDRSEGHLTLGSQMTGGLRDYENQYDYFNPTGDGLNRTDDILMVVHEYFNDDPVGSPDYESRTDRTAIIGGDPWDLGPPNGQQRVDDILAVVKQYFHDCRGAFSETIDLDTECDGIVKEDEEPAGEPELAGGEIYIECYLTRNPNTGEVIDVVKTQLSGPETVSEGEGVATVSGADFPNIVVPMGEGEAAAVPIGYYRCESEKKFESLIFRTDLAVTKIVLRGYIVLAGPFVGGVGFTEAWAERDSEAPWSISERGSVDHFYEDIYQAYRLKARTFTGFHGKWALNIFGQTIGFTEDMEIHVSTTLYLNSQGNARCSVVGFRTG